jgi:RNA polymerase primary sigma factor
LNTACAKPIGYTSTKGEASVTGYLSDLKNYRVMEAEEEFKLFRNIDKLGQEYIAHLVTSPLLLKSIRKVLPRMNCKDKDDSAAGDILRQIQKRNGRRISAKLIQEIHVIARQSTQCRIWMRHLEFISLHDEDGTFNLENWGKELQRRKNKFVQAKNQFVNLNLRLVIRLAKNFQGYTNHMSFSDLIQEGNLGLMRAVEKYDVTRGFRFSTYASWWIRQQIHRAITDQDKPVRVPVHMADILLRYSKLESKHMNTFGRSFTPDEASQAIGLPPGKIEVLATIKNASAYSLDAPLNAEGDFTFLDVLADPKASNQHEETYRGYLSRDIHRAMGILTAQERDIINQRFGMDGLDNTKTLAEIAVKYDLSRERIRQLEARALQKMRDMRGRSSPLKEHRI